MRKKFLDTHVHQKQRGITTPIFLQEVRFGSPLACEAFSARVQGSLRQNETGVSLFQLRRSLIEKSVTVPGNARY